VNAWPPGDRVDVLINITDPELAVPSYAHSGDAGADLATAEDVVLEPGERAVVGTGIAIAIPQGHVGLVHPRSGLAARTGLTVLNAPGTIDAQYRGEVQVCLINTDARNSIRLARGDRIAQLVIQPVSRAEFTPVAVLPDSVRGADGYGSTGGHPSLIAEQAHARASS
jgi:dUTP pyrophosphatase